MTPSPVPSDGQTESLLLLLLLLCSCLGAFLIPYFIMVLICGVPLVYMEIAIGQCTRLGPVHAFAKICPLFKGKWHIFILVR